MRFATVDSWPVTGDQLVEFVPIAGGVVSSPIPPSVNQRFHLDAARRAGDGPGHWLACAFDLPAPVELDRLRAAVSALIARHQTLRSGFHAGPDGPTRFVVSGVEVSTRPARHCPDVRAVLTTRLSEVCRPLSWPSSLFAVIPRADGASVFCGFDHRDVDGYSLAVVVRELRETYLGRAVRPATGGFLDHCEEEGSTPSSPSTRAAAVAGWSRFLAEGGGSPPAFPLPLGMLEGRRVAQRTTDRPLLDVHAAARLERRCRAAGAGVLAGLLAAVGLTIRRLGAAPRLGVCVPVHTRRHPRWENSIGWFVTNIPVVFPISSEFDDTLDSAAVTVRGALTYVNVPLTHVLAQCDFRRRRDDIFMISYLDYRRCPGAEYHVSDRAYHLSAVTTADDAQFWFYRTHEGIFLRSRYPGTPTAERTLTAFQDTLRGILDDAMSRWGSQIPPTGSV